MRYLPIVLSTTLAFGCGYGELRRSQDSRVWVEDFSHGGGEVKLKDYFHSEYGLCNVVGLYDKRGRLASLEIKPGRFGSVNDRKFVRDSDEEYSTLSKLLEQARSSAQTKVRL